MIGTSIAGIALDHLQPIVAGARTLDAATLDALIAQVTLLQASDTPLADALIAEQEQFALYLGEAAFQPASWVPPGGWPSGMKSPNFGSDAVDGVTLDTKDWGAAMPRGVGDAERGARRAMPGRRDVRRLRTWARSAPPARRRKRPIRAPPSPSSSRRATSRPKRCARRSSRPSPRSGGRRTADMPRVAGTCSRASRSCGSRSR